MNASETIATRPWLVPIPFDAEADREQWQAARRDGYGGSDAAAIVGESSDKSAITVWNERTGGGDSFSDNERTITGRQLEDPVTRWFAQGQPLWPRRGGELDIVKPPTVYHRDRPWQRGSADGLAYEPDAVTTWIASQDEKSKFVATRLREMWDCSWHHELIRSPLAPLAGLEVKTHGWFGSMNYGHEDEVLVGVPADKRIQCAWYMELYELDVWYLAALVDTHIRKTFVLERDKEIGATLLEEVERFHRRYVLTGDVPPPDGTKSYREHLRAKFKTHDAEFVEATPEVEASVAALLEIKRQQDTLKKSREKHEQVIKALIGDHMGVKTSLGNVTWKSQASGKLREAEARAELYKVAGWTDAEICAFEERHKQPDHRVMRTPK